MRTCDTTLKKLVTDALSDQQDIRLVIVFGSLAKGEGTADSDLDIAVDVGRPLRAEEKKTLIEVLALATGRPVDLVDLRRCGEPLLGQILRYGAVVIGSARAYGEMLSRHLIDQADFLPYRDRILEERRRRWIGS